MFENSDKKISRGVMLALVTAAISAAVIAAVFCPPSPAKTPKYITDAERQAAQSGKTPAPAVETAPAPAQPVVSKLKGGTAMLTKNLHWLGHDCFRVDGTKTIYIDPYQLSGNPAPADIILVTHEHYDHFSPQDIDKILTPKTTVVSIEAVTRKARGITRTVRAGDSMQADGVTMNVVPAYNIRADRQGFHPKSAGKVGYVFTLDGVTYYHAGDTDAIPEMKNIACDVAILPVSGTYVMDPSEALSAAKMVKAKIFIPMHWGAGVVGDLKDALKFADLVVKAGLKADILKQEK